MSESLVAVRHASRIYPYGQSEVVALSDVTCTVEPGARIAIMGPSGSGKSTLLQLMGGLDRPTSGEISWPALGPPAGLRPAQVGLVFQTQSLLAPLTALENVELPLLLQSVASKTARDAARDALESLDLGEIADKLPEEISGGQAQRVAVARALVSRPRLLLADEPTGQLDHPTAQHLFDVLLQVLEQSHLALVVATHDPAIADRLPAQWRMHHGVLEAPT
ncbi:MAG TPA: ABC transporter ATP-binding protein [Armatimonadota bacterium]|jgi:putative ABC transport system ATP-binding protein/lipoprotein-releasing system ATP-binding protein